MLPSIPEALGFLLIWPDSSGHLWSHLQIALHCSVCPSVRPDPAASSPFLPTAAKAETLLEEPKQRSTYTY